MSVLVDPTSSRKNPPGAHLTKSLWWTSSFLVLIGLFVHPLLAERLAIPAYLLFWCLLVLGVVLGIHSITVHCGRRRDILTAVTYLALLAFYLFSLRLRAVPGGTTFGLDPYFEIGAIRRILAGEYRFGSPSPYPAVSEFPMIQLLTAQLMALTGADVLGVAQALLIVLSFASFVLFVITARLLVTDWRLLATWSFAFLATSHLLLLNFQRELLGFPLLLLFLYWLVRRKRERTVSSSLILAPSIRGSHEHTPSRLRCPGGLK